MITNLLTFLGSGHADDDTLPSAPRTRAPHAAGSPPCELHRLKKWKLVATATDEPLRHTKSLHFFPDPHLGWLPKLGFGQDVTFKRRELPPGVPSVGATPAELVPKMRFLLGVFARNDPHGMAQRLFEEFFKQSRVVKGKRVVRWWSDKHLNATAKAHPNIVAWVSRAMSAPDSPDRNEEAKRIHQALAEANWNLDEADLPLEDLGVMAFNKGNKYVTTGDYSNGLVLMIDGIQRVTVLARAYHYNRCKREYYIKLKLVLYDVFGLDDLDLAKFGVNGTEQRIALTLLQTNSVAMLAFQNKVHNIAEGFTAWWQLQHQHFFAPLITRIEFERELTISTR